MSEESNDKKLHTRIFFALVSIFQKYGKVLKRFAVEHFIEAQTSYISAE